MDYLITFLEGIVTFVSPCLLPLLPVYIAFFAGGAAEGGATSRAGASASADAVSADADAAPGSAGSAGSAGAGVSDAGGAEGGSLRRTLADAGGAEGGSLRRTLAGAAGFVIGFTLVFTLLGALAASLGSAFSSYSGAVNAVCGAIVVVLGLNYLGALRIPVLQRTFKLHVDVVPRGFASSLLFGMVFAVGWTPCVGVFLGSALSLAASSAESFHGIALLLCYSLGLGLPFFVSAILIDRLENAFAWIKAHYAAVNRVCGALLVLVGLLMASGQLGLWLRLLAA